jgi:low affinity Fe/Cu permease
MSRTDEKSTFNELARNISDMVGSSRAFAVACGAVVLWLVSGPIFNYSDTWQLVINTGTTIVTFLMVFLIQKTQNRDAKALHLKLDELLRTTVSARNRLIDLEDCTDEELERLQQQFEKLRKGHDTAREPAAEPDSMTAAE